MVVRYIRLSTNLLNNVGSTLKPLSSLLSFVHVSRGVGVALEFIILNLFNKSKTYEDNRYDGNLGDAMVCSSVHHSSISEIFITKFSACSGF